VTSAVRRTGAIQSLRVVPGRTTTLRITIADSRGGVPGGPGAGFTSITIPGVTVTRYLSPAQDPAGRLASEVAFSFHRQVPSPASLADLATYPPMAREFSIGSRSMFRFSGSAIAVPGPALDGLLARLAPAPTGTLQVTASSTLGSLPSLAPYNLFKAGQQGSWIAGAGKPVLRLRWQGKRTIRRMVILPVAGFGAAPESIKITSPDGVRYASIGLDGLTEIAPPVVTDRMTISFPVVQYTAAVLPGWGQVVQLPVGLSKLSIPALNGLRATAPAASATFQLACGGGPKVMIDGRSFATSVSGTFGDLTQFLPVQVRLCLPWSELSLGAGQHRMLAARSGPFTLTDVSMVSAFGAASLAGRLPDQPRAVRIQSWGAELRRVSVGPGGTAYLELHQNANPGWVATLHGHALTSVQLDGWQQGFVVPAGTGGVVTMTFSPAKFYHAWIILSAAGAIVLLTIAFSPRRRRRVPDKKDRAARAAAAAAPAAGSTPTAARSTRSSWLIGMLALTVLVLIIGGPAVIAVPLLAYLAYRWPNRYGVVALAAVVASGLVAALAAHKTSAGSGAFSGIAQAFALIALAAALVPVRPGRSGETR
jgi:arabinofuranan 3-O-arabinosyltransferase